MRKGRVLAAAYLAAGFMYISVVAIIVEPRLGLSEASDYLNPAKISGVVGMPVMIAGNVMMLGFSVALAYLSARSEDVCFRIAGFMSAFAFLVLGCLGQAAASLPTLISDGTQQEAAQLSLAAVRTAFLRVGVLSLGIFAWRSTIVQTVEGSSILWRALGVIILVGSCAFFFVALPVPLLFTVWAAWYAFRASRATWPRDGAASEISDRNGDPTVEIAPIGTDSVKTRI